jgi:hypothetical protein
LQGPEADVKLLQVGKAWRAEPALDLSGILGFSFLGLVEADGGEAEAARRARMIREDLAYSGEALKSVVAA